MSLRAAGGGEAIPRNSGSCAYMRLLLLKRELHRKDSKVGGAYNSSARKRKIRLSMVNEMHNQSSSPPVALEPRYITRVPNEQIILYEGLIHI
ncbi:MAG: hypothetical protein C0184_00430 [Chloroflexus aggregans]|uniref:Uncharacterized protein n=1 Tax=Chloroflexus aggregans TaxID=152260 RepID=A0A2J6XFX9_9CHLR|nr:MAG: hypothetical protein C0184_00430 [Chloroflexus aggregans]